MKQRPKVFISYRREESSWCAGRVGDSLSRDFDVFLDSDSIHPGDDFATDIVNSLSACTCVVAIIGKGWLAELRRRISNPEDYVRLELSYAISHDIAVVPVLVDGAPLPRAADLPSEIRELAGRQALTLDREVFPHQIARVKERIRNDHKARQTPRLLREDLAIALWFIAAVCIFFLFRFFSLKTY